MIEWLRSVFGSRPRKEDPVAAQQVRDATAQTAEVREAVKNANAVRASVLADFKKQDDFFKSRVAR